MSRVSRAFITAFEDTLDVLDVSAADLTEERQEQLGRQAALLSVAELAWSDHLGPLFDWRAVAGALGTIKSRQGVNDLAQRQRLLALPSKSGTMLYPAFQLQGGRPLAAMPSLLPIFQEGDVSAWTVASWFCTPQDELDGETPTRWLRAKRPVDPVLTAARRLVAGLAA